MNVMGIIFASDGNIGSLTDKRTMGSLPTAAVTVRSTFTFPTWLPPVSTVWASSPATTIRAL